MKSTPRKTAARGLHQPIPELEKALAMPQGKRRSGGNRIHFREKEYSVSSNGIKVVQHTR